MANTWQEYQQEAAELFRSFGWDAEVEAHVEGARAAHEIDVAVRFDLFGVEVLWVIECKFWNSAIPKEKVLTLQQITQDVGADRAFLLSESGFQSGAVRAAQNTNVTLSNLDDLRDAAENDRLRVALTQFTSRVVDLDDRLSDILILDDHRPGPAPGVSFDEVVELTGSVFAIRLAIPKAMVDAFPVRIVGLTAVTSLPDFVSSAADELGTITEELERLEERVRDTRTEAHGASMALEEAVRELIRAGEAALFSDAGGEEAWETLRLEALEAMKTLGRRADALKPLIAGRADTSLSTLMRCLIDGVYLQLAKPEVPLADWEEAAQNTKLLMHHLADLVNPNE